MWLSYVGRIEHNAAGVPVLAIGFKQDITALRLAEPQQEESSRTMQLALQIARAGVWEWNIGADRVTGDENLARLFDLPVVDVVAGRLPAEEFFRSIHPEDRLRVDPK